MRECDCGFSDLSRMLCSWHSERGDVGLHEKTALQSDTHKQKEQINRKQTAASSGGLDNGRGPNLGLDVGGVTNTSPTLSSTAVDPPPNRPLGGGLDQRSFPFSFLLGQTIGGGA